MALKPVCGLVFALVLGASDARVTGLAPTSGLQEGDFPETCVASGINPGDECFDNEEDSYELLSCNQYLNGEDCGNEYPGDMAAGPCTETSQRYRICNTPEDGEDACAQMEIYTVEDCAQAVLGHIEEGLCDESRLFYSSLCKEDRTRASCVCHYAGGVVGNYTDTEHGNSIYKVLQQPPEDMCAYLRPHFWLLVLASVIALVSA